MLPKLGSAEKTQPLPLSYSVALSLISHSRVPVPVFEIVSTPADSLSPKSRLEGLILRVGFPETEVVDVVVSRVVDVVVFRVVDVLLVGVTVVVVPLLLELFSVVVVELELVLMSPARPKKVRVRLNTVGVTE